MTELENPAEIERIVGVKRSEFLHIARAVSEENRVYLMHSQECVDQTPDLRDCYYSKLLDNGIDESVWNGYFDRPVYVRRGIYTDRLAPIP